MQVLDLPLPCVPYEKRMGKEPTFSKRRGFSGVAKNHPSMGSTTCGVLIRGRYSKTVRATSWKLSSSVAS
ncbi:hypothetical protein MYXA107069_38030 [Myxococcus xanthus]